MLLEATKKAKKVIADLTPRETTVLTQLWSSYVNGANCESPDMLRYAMGLQDATGYAAHCFGLHFTVVDGRPVIQEQYEF